MTTPPQYPGAGDNQEPGNNEPFTHQPYGQQPAYGQQPGGYPAGQPYGQWQGGNDAGKSTDGLSIAAFVLSLTCCLSIVGMILGFVGLGRTKGGQRKGRWAAVSAIAIGAVLTLASVGIGVGIWVFAKSMVTEDNVAAGMCMNVSESSGDSVGLRKKECSESHDAQVVYVGTFGEIKDKNLNPTNMDDLTDAGVSYAVCQSLLGSDVSALESSVDGDLKYNIVRWADDPDDDDTFACYVQRADKKKLTEKIG
ncbi:DUF4190 domain-containing protein [Nocardioides sp. AE5]|uniref:DUF4190 domain-containing protein n=1 Tax=Nocardioides sp. AE5 TaxID=2962573 RepID=UPI002881E1DD|nr:DUF4190 domain-containing protein [Nocardioides sp. AE5]MDT0202811.1 DUF4190 domain-containing protein [Nocardioides sp. AE5]